MIRILFIEMSNYVSLVSKPNDCYHWKVLSFQAGKVFLKPSLLQSFNLGDTYDGRVLINF
jgi:hypothetical protein